MTDQDPDPPRDLELVQRYHGKTIEIARMEGDRLWLAFTDGSGLTFSDEDGQCCENRYMTCDDDLATFTGEKFIGIDILGAPNVSAADNMDDHELQFLHVRLASGNVITCESHNEHNGYYGGFDVRVREAVTEHAKESS